MAAAKDKAGDLRVVVPFAYATTTSGEVKQLVKGDLVDPALFKKESVDHLKSIGFIGQSE